MWCGEGLGSAARLCRLFALSASQKRICLRERESEELELQDDKAGETGQEVSETEISCRSCGLPFHLGVTDRRPVHGTTTHEK
jgi:hypothetical protein